MNERIHKEVRPEDPGFLEGHSRQSRLGRSIQALGNQPGLFQRWLQTGLHIVAGTAFLCSLTGCGTLMRGSESLHLDGETYPACQADAYLIVCGLFPAIADLPISLVTDTLLLPYDRARIHKS